MILTFLTVLRMSTQHSPASRLCDVLRPMRPQSGALDAQLPPLRRDRSRAFRRYAPAPGSPGRWRGSGRCADDSERRFVRASCSNRALWRPFSRLIATRQSRRVSRAFHTSPMPPSPISHGASLSRGESGIHSDDAQLSGQSLARTCYAPLGQRSRVHRQRFLGYGRLATCQPA
jgi:hypothetical protein